MMKMPCNYAEYLIRHHTLTRRAHLAEQTGAQQGMCKRIRFRALLSACQRKEHPGDAGLGSADPRGRPNLSGQVHFEEQSWSRHLDIFHMCTWRESASTSINRAPLPLIQHTHTHTFHLSHIKALLLLV